jgi:hypothetical protein
MGIPSASDVATVGTGAALLALPFASQLDKLDWHFKWNNVSQKTIFNTCASLMGSALYSSLMYQAPVRWLIEYSWLWWFGMFVVAIAIYYGLYVAVGGTVGSGKSVAALPVALVVYIVMFAAIATLMAYVFTLQNYYLFAGHIRTKAGIPMRGVLVEVDVGSQREGYDITNRRGFFLVGLKSDDYSNQSKSGEEVKLSAARGAATVLTDQTLVWKTNTNLEFESSD